MGELVNDRGHQEAKRDEAPDDPLERDREGGRRDRGLLRAHHGHDGGKDGPCERDPDLDAEQPPDGHPLGVHASSLAARRRANQASPTDSTMTTTPTPIVVSIQNCSGNSWTRRSVPGSKR